MTKDEASQWLDTLAAKFLSANHRELLNEEVVSLLEARRREFEQVFLTGIVRGFTASDCSSVLEVLSERHSKIQERKNRTQDLGGGSSRDGVIVKIRSASEAMDTSQGLELVDIDDGQSPQSPASEVRVEAKPKKLGSKFRKR